MNCMHEYQRSFAGDPHPTLCTHCGESRGQTEWRRRFKELTGFERNTQ